MGFYDSKGYWRNEGDGFYDSKGYFRGPKDGFYDGKGYFRSPGDGFYDFRGNWVNPGGVFYDSKGYRRSITNSETLVSGEKENGAVFIGFILLLPVILFGLILTSLIEWVTAHFYIVFISYCFISASICLVVTRIKKHRGARCLLSFIGNYLSILSFVYITLLYTVPNVKTNGDNFNNLFEFFLVSLFEIGGIAVIQFFNYYHEKAILEFVCGTLYFAVVINILKNEADVINSLANLADIYNIESNIFLKFLFGFAI